MPVLNNPLSTIRRTVLETATPVAVSIATHEAAHAVVALDSGIPIAWVSRDVDPASPGLVGRVKFSGDPCGSRDWLHVLVAGPRSRTLLSPDCVARGQVFDEDVGQIKEALGRLVGHDSRSQDELLDEAEAAVDEAFRRYESELNMLSAMLLRHTRLTAADVASVCPTAHARLEQHRARTRPPVRRSPEYQRTHPHYETRHREVPYETLSFTRLS